MRAYRRAFLAGLAALIFLPTAVPADEDEAALSKAWNAYLTSLDSGDTVAIIEAAEAAVVVGREVLRDGDKALPVLLLNYGNALLEDEQNEAAESVLSESLKLSERLHGKKALELIEILMALGDSVAKPYSSSRQFTYYKRSLNLIKQHFGRESEEFASAAVRAAVQGYERSLTADGIRYLHDAREIYTILHGENAPSVGMSEYLLAKFEFTRRKYTSVEKHALKALPKLEGDSPNLRRMQLFTRALLVKAYEERDLSEKATPHCIAIGRIGESNSSQEYFPIFRKTPQYPVSELRAGNQGYVDFEFAIDEYGFVREPQIISSSGGGFESAALEAVERFRYAPRFVDGVATKAMGVKARITFKLAD